ncbi:MAG: glutamine-hydrolyzing GMP synthase [Deltaproteobacteria bacterium]|nr:glutamine-hydrolyzing GMP synthase [Deltaproteobacteria bacterium]
MDFDKIGIIDFGGQYAHLIATKVRRLNVYSEIRQPDDPIEKFYEYKGIIISGSPSLSSFGEDSEYNKKIYDLDVPIIGFCFGHQEIAKHYGGRVVHGGREWGEAKFKILKKNHPLFEGLSDVESVFMSHFDSVDAIGPDFEEFGISYLTEGMDIHRFAAIGSDKYKRYGFQFHPEVDDTINGEKMIANFIFNICRCRPNWTMEEFIRLQFEKIKNQVQDKSVFLLVSGGVDSTVAAVLLKEILGIDRLRLLHIDNGLMRKDESKEVLERFKKLGFNNNLFFRDASDVFLDSLKEVFEPEKKREIIGDTFVKVFAEEAERLKIGDFLLGQGTIYPDTIETGGTKRADVIKTHHNRVPIIQKMINEGRVVEPLAELYKVEVRELGRKLGIDEDILNRHPFPGPGIAVRVLCNSGCEDLSDMKEIEASLQSMTIHHNINAIVLPIKSVGVKADLRSYERPVLFNSDYNEKVFEIASDILAKIKGINRCIVNISPYEIKEAKPLRAFVTNERLSLLREIDYLVNSILKKAGIYYQIWQCPVVILPLSLNGRGEEMVVVRPVLSERAMTARAALLPEGVIRELSREIHRFPKVSGVAVDITSKPPGTIEWE